MHALGVFFASILALFQATFSTHLAASAMTQPLWERPAAGTTASIIFGGDMMFDRTIRSAAQQKGGDYLFSCIDGTLASADFVVANLEGPITATSSRSLGSAIGAPDNFVFTFPLDTASLLAAHHVGVVNLGNNHILNFGMDGAESTVSALDAARVAHFGSPQMHEVAHVSVRGIKLALINYNEFYPAQGSGVSTLTEIREARAAGEIPLVYTHWGVEYATTSPQYVRDLAHEFVDAGAAAVLGSHPHVVEEHELYKGAPIYYSLGNFIFDQYWDDAVDHGLLVRVSFDARGVTAIREIPTVLKRDRQVCPVQ